MMPQVVSKAPARRNVARHHVWRLHPEQLTLTPLMPRQHMERSEVLLSERWNRLQGLEGRLACVASGDLRKLSRWIDSVLARPAARHPECTLRVNLSGIGLQLVLSTSPDPCSSPEHGIAMYIRQLPTWDTEQPEVEKLAHDIRATLQNLSGMVQVVKLRHADVPAEWVRALQAGFAFLADQTDELEQLARPTHKRKPTVRTVHVRRLLDEIAAYFQPQALASSLMLTIKYNLSDHSHLTFDANAMRSILHNLIGNAVKYTPTGGRIELIVSVLPEERYLEVRVLDNGTGFTDQQRRRAFQPYTRLESSRGTEGSGLGLSITKWVAQRSGGSVELYSSPGQGSEFVVRLPCRMA